MTVTSEVQTPGEALSQRLKELGVGQIILAQDTNLTTKHINRIIKGKEGISAAVALKLERFLPPHPASYWLVIDYKWRLSVARANQLKE